LMGLDVEMINKVKFDGVPDEADIWFGIQAMKISLKLLLSILMQWLLPQKTCLQV
jgi:hypothetical protein